MRRKRLARAGLLGGAASGAALLLLSGCELLVDFDRSKIPQDSGSVSFEGAPGPDAGADADATVGTPAGDGGDGGTVSGDATLSDAPVVTPDASADGTAEAGDVLSPGVEAAAPEAGATEAGATEAAAAPEAAPGEAAVEAAVTVEASTEAGMDAASVVDSGPGAAEGAAPDTGTDGPVDDGG